MAAEGHVAHHGDPETHGVGGDHVGVKVLCQDVDGLHQDVHQHHGLHQHYGVQGHHGGQHVPLFCGQRPFGHAINCRGYIEVQLH